MSDERKNDETGHGDGGVEQPAREKMFARRAMLRAGFALPLVALGAMARKSRGESNAAFDYYLQDHYDQGYHADFIYHIDHHDHHAGNAQGEGAVDDRLAANHYDHHDHHAGNAQGKRSVDNRLAANHHDHHDHHVS